MIHNIRTNLTLEGSIGHMRFWDGCVRLIKGFLISLKFRNLITGSEVSFESWNSTVPHHEVRRSVTNFKREYLRNDASELHKILQTCSIGYEFADKIDGLLY